MWLSFEHRPHCTSVFSKHFKKKGKKRKNSKNAALTQAGTYLAKLLKVLLYVFHYCISR